MLKITHLIVQEDEIHLNEDERHPGGRRQRQQHIVALCVALQLKVLPELQARVDHAADAERHRAHPQVEAAVVAAPAGRHGGQYRRPAHLGLALAPALAGRVRLGVRFVVVDALQVGGGGVLWRPVRFGGF